MGLKANWTDADVERELAKRIVRINDAIILRLKRLGEDCVATARTNGSYTDQTGNLRSSVGYVIVRDGHIIDSFFGSANKDEGQTGQNTGKSYAESLAGNYINSCALIVVAGMEYAAAVESKGRDVLISAEIFAQQKLPGMLAALKLNLA